MAQSIDPVKLKEPKMPKAKHETVSLDKWNMTAFHAGAVLIQYSLAVKQRVDYSKIYLYLLPRQISIYVDCR